MLRVRERAIEGAANDACVKAVAEALGLASSQVALLRGHRGRIKTFAVTALDEREIGERLHTRIVSTKGSRP